MAPETRAASPAHKLAIAAPRVTYRRGHESVSECVRRYRELASWLVAAAGQAQRHEAAILCTMPGGGFVVVDSREHCAGILDSIAAGDFAHELRAAPPQRDRIAVVVLPHDAQGFVVVADLFVYNSRGGDA